MPIIGIPASISTGREVAGERFFVSENYIAAIVSAGGVPVILPPAVDFGGIMQQMRMVHGLLLIGGYDVDPALYGQEPLPGLGPVFPDRDAYEIAVACAAAHQGKPLLGICRGIQVVNVAFGGKLYQDLSQFPGPILQHYQKGHRSAPGHNVELRKETLLRRIFGQETVRTNSYHHQVIMDVAPGFVINGRTSDGIIEGIENKAATILGVQWHPEMLQKNDPLMRRLFSWLIDSAG